MSEVAFQTALARLVASGTLREAAIDRLDAREFSRLSSVADQTGVRIMRTLYYSWRLTKILSLLPYTTAMLDEERLAAELRAFWDQRPSTTLYFVPECLEFLSFLAERIDTRTVPRYWGDLLSFEKARLKMREAAALSRSPLPQSVQFRHDPSQVFAALRSDPTHAAVDPMVVELVGTLDDDGTEKWRVASVSQE